jgi:hypothetical protein
MDSEEKKISIKFNVIAIIAIIILCFAVSPKTLQNDTFYTIKIGELIINNGIDMQDHFSWHEDLPYTYPHWAYDTGIYIIYHLGEISGIPDGGMVFIYASTIILASILGILIYYTSQKLTKNKLVSFVITLFSIYLLKNYIAARAQLVTFILFALTILFIENFLEIKKKRYLVGIVLISIIIANVHVAVWPFFFVLFLPYIAEYVIAWIAEKKLIERLKVFNQKDIIRDLERKLNKCTNENKKIILQQKIEKAKEKLKYEEEIYEKIKVKSVELRQNPYKIKVIKNDAVKWLVLVMIICAFTGLLTPLGTTPYTYLVKTMQGNTTQSISEHLPLTLYNNKPIMIVLALLLMILIFTDTKIKLRDLFMLAGLIYLSFMSRRQISLLILIGGFIFAKLVTYLVEKYDKKNCEKFTKFVTNIIGRVLILAIIIIISFIIYKPKINDEYINQSTYPVDAATWILENLDVENIKLFNEYNYGSYLLFRGIPVFIDSRADLYAPEFNGEKNEDGEYEGRNIFTDYINVSSISTYYETKFEEYEITHVIITKNSKLNMFLSRDEKYNELYSDSNFVIYERGSIEDTF